VTQLKAYPEFLRKDVERDGSLRTYANGEIDYCLKDVHARVCVRWNFEAPTGAGDTHYSVMRGSKANLVIRQGAAESWQPVLYIERSRIRVRKTWRPRWTRRCAMCARRIRHRRETLRRQLAIDRSGVLSFGHEAHFAQVAQEFLGCVEKRSLPDWEVPAMIAKYHTTTRALAIAETCSPG